MGRKIAFAKKHDYHSTKGIAADSVSAKASGVSYGKYKAGVKADKQSSDYAFSATAFIKRSEKQKDVKAKALAVIKLY